MKLVVGLGNPGRKYEQTRHNIGFDVVRTLARRLGAAAPREAFQAEVAEVALGSARALLVCPQTFMNRSGESVVRARDFYKLANADVLVVCDDMNLPLGKLRVRGSGSAGGQKGLADILQRLGGEDVPRLRIGIGPPPAGWDPADYVLSKFGQAERSEVELAVVRAADAVEVWATAGVAQCMNRFNA